MEKLFYFRWVFRVELHKPYSGCELLKGVSKCVNLIKDDYAITAYTHAVYFEVHFFLTKHLESLV